MSPAKTRLPTARAVGVGGLIAATLVLTATTAMAARIEKACLRSERTAASAPLCTCIQRVADQTLTRSDQRMAAKFFRDPQMAQDIRQSDNDRHSDFWRRYRTFGTTAQRVCR
ncbi:hypothetical protein [Mangrovicoccus algicola]|uniref:Arginine transporter n=1 Tax=Mangrovicoccus algicola TaxID=2771008 RepID=A0A8J6YXC1_9RHOB|nr:hypothetical protein [Mangrovicoccus algicola]MBE3639397.1 hypothetical protein [Mangrovicoccus algicola]